MGSSVTFTKLGSKSFIYLFIYSDIGIKTRVIIRTQETIVISIKDIRVII